MKQYLILLAAVVAMAILAGCERSGAEDDREFDSKTDGLRFRLGTDSVSTSLGADQTELHKDEANRALAAVVKKEKPKTSPLIDTGLKPVGGTGTGTGTGTTGTGTGTGTGTETGTGTGTTTGTGTETGPGTETGTATGTGTGTETGTGTGKSAIDGDGIVDGDK